MYPRATSTSLSPLHFLAVCAVLLLGAVKAGYGQKVYANGTITGGLNGAGLLVGDPYGISRVGGGFGTVGNLTLLDIPTNSTNNYYYAGTIHTGSNTPTGVGVSNNMLGEDETNPAVISANKGLNALLIPLSGSDAYIQFRFNNNLDVSTPVFVKLKEKPQISTTLDLELLGILGLSASKHIVGEVYTGAIQPQNYSFLLTSIQNQHVGTSLGTSTNPTITRLLIDKHGEWYASILPTVSSGTYNSVRLTVQFPPGLSLLSTGNSASVNVYNAFIDTLGNACSIKPLYTNEGEASGITLDLGAASNLLNLSEIVKNPVAAIDDDLNSYSSFSSGILGVGVLNTVSQTVYFDHVASSNDAVNVRLGLSNDLIGLDLLALNGITFFAYKGTSETPVWAGSLSNLAELLGLDLLNLISIGENHGELNLTFKPEVEFDRIKIELNRGVLGVDVIGDALRVYNVSLAPSIPEISDEGQPKDVTVCETANASFTVTATSPSDSISAYQWQYFNGTDWIAAEGISNQPVYTIEDIPISFNNRRYRVAVTGGMSGCPQTIYSNETMLTVIELPGKPHLTITDIHN